MAKSGSSFEIGLASADITPPVGVRLSGYAGRTAPSTAVAHSLRAEAMVCRAGGGAWAILTTDIIGYPHDFVLELRKAVAKKTGLPAGALLVSATHTHAGPASLRTYQENLDDVDHVYRARLAETLPDLVTRAFGDLKPACIEAAWAESTDLASNRRVIGPDGKWTNEWRDPDGRHTGYYDPSILLVGIRRPDGKLAGLLVNYGCHPVTLGPKNLEISADYVGYMKDFVEAHGAAGLTLFALAGAANINPRVCVTVGNEAPRRMGERLGQTVLDAIARLKPVEEGPVAWSSSPWHIDVSPGKEIAKRLPVIDTEVQALRAGGLALVALPGELFSEYTRWLRDASPFAHTAVVSVANDSVGYLPTDEAQVQGAYEPDAAPTDKLEKPLLDHARRALAEVAAKQAGATR